ncbi:MAG: hypothetical protein QM530_05795, partial [Phycisphaerales bacterium]|nr:hypothetical protein [Phycisphaerales bacterium]
HNILYSKNRAKVLSNWYYLLTSCSSAELVTLSFGIPNFNSFFDPKSIIFDHITSFFTCWVQTQYFPSQQRQVFRMKNGYSNGLTIALEGHPYCHVEYNIVFAPIAIA